MFLADSTLWHIVWCICSFLLKVRLSCTTLCGTSLASIHKVSCAQWLSYATLNGVFSASSVAPHSYKTSPHILVQLCCNQALCLAELSNFVLLCHTLSHYLAQLFRYDAHALAHWLAQLFHSPDMRIIRGKGGTPPEPIAGKLGTIILMTINLPHL